MISQVDGEASAYPAVGPRPSRRRLPTVAPGQANHGRERGRAERGSLASRSAPSHSATDASARWAAATVPAPPTAKPASHAWTWPSGQTPRVCSEPSPPYRPGAKPGFAGPNANRIVAPHGIVGLAEAPRGRERHGQVVGVVVVELPAGQVGGVGVAGRGAVRDHLVATDRVPDGRGQRAEPPAADAEAVQPRQRVPGEDPVAFQGCPVLGQLDVGGL